MPIRSGEFRPEDLVPAPEPPGGWVILNSGGPLMAVETVYEDGGVEMALCRWEEWPPDPAEWSRGMKINRARFPTFALSRLVPYRTKE